MFWTCCCSNQLLISRISASALVLILTACSASGNKRNCELECDDCKRVTFTCGAEDKTIEAGGPGELVP